MVITWNATLSSKFVAQEAEKRPLSKKTPVWCLQRHVLAWKHRESLGSRLFWEHPWFGSHDQGTSGGEVVRTATRWWNTPKLEGIDCSVDYFRDWRCRSGSHKKGRKKNGWKMKKKYKKKHAKKQQQRQHQLPAFLFLLFFFSEFFTNSKRHQLISWWPKVRPIHWKHSISAWGGFGFWNFGDDVFFQLVDRNFTTHEISWNMVQKGWRPVDTAKIVRLRFEMCSQCRILNNSDWPDQNRIFQRFWPRGPFLDKKVHGFHFVGGAWPGEGCVGRVWIFVSNLAQLGILTSRTGWLNTRWLENMIPAWYPNLWFDSIKSWAVPRPVWPFLFCLDAACNPFLLELSPVKLQIFDKIECIMLPSFFGSHNLSVISYPPSWLWCWHGWNLVWVLDVLTSTILYSTSTLFTETPLYTCSAVVWSVGHCGWC